MDKNFVLSIHANIELENYYLRSVSDEKITFTSGTAFEIHTGW